MLKDITIGQHFPGHSVLHRCDPRLKLVATIAYIIVLFIAPNPLGLALSIGLLALLYRIARIPGRMILKSLKPIVPIILFTAVLNLFFVTGQGEQRFSRGRTPFLMRPYRAISSHGHALALCGIAGVILICSCFRFCQPSRPCTA